MKKVLFMMLALIAMSVVAQKKEKIKGNREVLIKKFTIPGFNEIKVGEKFEVELLKTNDTTRLEIETDDNLFDVIHFQVDNGVLSFSTSKEIVKKKRLRITVFVPNSFHKIDIIEKGNVKSKETLELNNLQIDCVNRGKATLNLNIKNGLIINATDKSNIDIDASSQTLRIDLAENAFVKAVFNTKNLDLVMKDHASAKFSGNVNEAKIETNGRADLKAAKFSINSAVLIADGKSKVKLLTTGNLLLKLSGDTEVSVYGSPKINLNRFTDHAVINKK